MYEKYVTLRDAKGMSDYAVAKETGITRSTFTDWKNGRSTPKPEKVMKLAKLFGVSLEYFYA